MSTLWEKHLMAALLLFRNLRLQVVMQNIDPRATRVALKYFMMVDTELSRMHGLTEEEDRNLTEIAKELFRQIPKEMRQVGSC